MREISLDRLRTLVAIADLGSFAEAARVLHLAPPTVSLHIADLESRVGGKLLSRTRGRIQPSAIGETLVERARRLLADAEQALEDVERQVQGLGRACAAGCLHRGHRTVDAASFGDVGPTPSRYRCAGRGAHVAGNFEEACRGLFGDRSGRAATDPGEGIADRAMAAGPGHGLLAGSLGMPGCCDPRLAGRPAINSE